MFWTIPTLMTWTRIVAIPLIVGVFYAPVDPATRNLIATVMFVVFAATDWLDGFLAVRAILGQQISVKAARTLGQ
eukprot:gene3868-4949_t